MRHTQVMRRREFLQAPALEACLRAENGQPRSLVYKKAGRCEIKADVFGIADNATKPAAIFIHGGALIMGSRTLEPGTPLLRWLLDAGFVVISIDYRLAPETKLPAIIEDVRDALAWARSQSATLRIDSSRIGVCGGSAGGYLTLMTGFAVRPAPKALVSFWGYGDIVGDWYSRPDSFYLKQPQVSRETALAAVGTEPLSEAPETSERFRFYLHCRQQGIWPKEVAGRDPEKEPRWFDRHCPERNVSRAYPPTLLVHGTADTDVPHALSVRMAERFRQVGVEHEFLSVPGAGHGLANTGAEEKERIYRRAAEFLKDRV
jgi:acetyl esterase/lipase